MDQLGESDEHITLLFGLLYAENEASMGGVLNVLRLVESNRPMASSRTSVAMLSASRPSLAFASLLIEVLPP